MPAATPAPTVGPAVNTTLPVSTTVAPTQRPTPAPLFTPPTFTQATPAPTALPSSNAAQSLYERAQANTINPTDVAFDETQGVAGRINSLISQGSPLFESAQTRARQRMAASGMLNSTMANQAGEQALLDTALPIAQADAGLSQQQRLANQGARNQSLLANAQNALTAATRGTELDVQNSQAQAELAQRERLQVQQENNRVAIAQMDASLRERLTNIEAANRATLSGDQNLASTWQSMLDTISRIQVDPNLDAGTKNTLIANNMAAFQAFANFWSTTRGVDVSNLLRFQMGPVPTPPPGVAPPEPAGGGNVGGPGAGDSGAGDGSGGP